VIEDGDHHNHMLTNKEETAKDGEAKKKNQMQKLYLVWHYHQQRSGNYDVVWPRGSIIVHSKFKSLTTVRGHE
jgi:hypothetical protein